MMDFSAKANSIYESIIKNLPTVSSIDYLNPPPVSRLWRKKGNTRLDPYKEWAKSYDNLKCYYFIIKRYIESLNALPAGFDHSEAYENLYIYENHENAEEFLSKHDYISNEKASKIFSDPDNRDFDAFSKRFVLNRDREDIDCFSNYLVSLSKEVINMDTSNLLYHQSENLYRLSRLFCLGPQGIGKTALLNNIFSVKSEFFSKNNVIWIRIDFNDRSLRKYSLVNAILFHFATIFHSYYLNSRRIPVCVNWDEFLDFYKDRVYFRELENDAKTFTSLLQPIPLREQISKRFIISLISFLQHKGYGIIFVIDGLDRISLEDYDSSTFRDLSEELKDTIFKKNFIKAVFILSIRYPSFKHILERIEGRWNIVNPDFMAFYLLAKDTDSIIKSKLKYARSIILEETRERQYNMGKSESLSFIDDNFLQAFEKEIYKITIKGLGLINDDGSFKHFLKISGYNYRMMFRCLKKIIEYFGWIIIDHAVKFKGKIVPNEVENTLETKKYNVLKAYMMGSDLQKDYYSTYKYKLTGNRITYVRQGYGRALIPNIFNYIENRDMGIWASNQIRILLKFRFLEYLKHNGPCSISELLDVLTKVYGYDQLYILAEVEEMFCECLIASTDLSSPFRNDFVYQISRKIPFESQFAEEIRITKLGLYIIEYVIDTYEYISLIVNDTPIPKEFYNRLIPINYYWENVDTNKAVAIGIYNALCFIHSFIFLLEESENLNIQKITAENSSTENYLFYFGQKEDISQRLYKSLKEQVIKMIAERIKTSERGFMAELRKIMPNLSIS